MKSSNFTVNSVQYYFAIWCSIQGRISLTNQDENKANNVGGSGQFILTKASQLPYQYSHHGTDQWRHLAFSQILEIQSLCISVFPEERGKQRMSVSISQGCFDLNQMI